MRRSEVELEKEEGTRVYSSFAVVEGPNLSFIFFEQKVAADG